jgi:hypothetical protein
MPYDRILIAMLAVALIVGFILFMQYSRTGRAMRALAQDRVAAQLMGVDVDRYSMIGFALGAMLAGLVGGLLVTITGINLGMGGPTSVKAFLMIMIGGAGRDLGRHRRRVHPGDDGVGRPDSARRLRRCHLPRDLRHADDLPRHPAAGPDGQAVGLSHDRSNAIRPAGQVTMSTSRLHRHRGLPGGVFVLVPL